MENYLLISDAAKEVKVESHVLRYWEDELHLPIKRNELGHRYYTAEDVERFKQIKGMKERGLQLKAIKMILRDGKLDVLPTEEGRMKETGAQESAKNPAQAGMQEGSDRESAKAYQNAMGWNTAEDSGARSAGRMAIDIIPNKNVRQEVTQESREDKSRRLQWLLQQLIRQTLQENNGELCREIRESVVKELDYQFRMQEEREEERDKMLARRDEEHFRKMDELLRKKVKRSGKIKADKNAEKQEAEENGQNAAEEEEKEAKEMKEAKAKKKRRFF
ncbi:MAG TPA: hypothetical protein DCZ91_03780 [Lachnospiraceae bacterium]|nr:hypothetical protein [Lachnospiraceae bacterium]